MNLNKYQAHWNRIIAPVDILIETPLITATLEAYADWWEDVTRGLYRVLKERGQLPWQS